MLLFHSFRPGLLRRFFVRSFPALCMVLCLALLSIACDTGNGDGFKNFHFIPTGEWTDGWGGGYTISTTTLEYYTAEMEFEGVIFPGLLMQGDIIIAHDFSDNSGVILIRITEIENMELTPGKYTAVYYLDYTASHVFLANPIDETWAPIETDTFAQAESLFTVDNVGTHVSNWGTGYGR